jgi:hypothetical protein
VSSWHIDYWELLPRTVFDNSNIAVESRHGEPIDYPVHDVLRVLDQRAPVRRLYVASVNLGKPNQNIATTVIGEGENGLGQVSTAITSREIKPALHLGLKILPGLPYEVSESVQRRVRHGSITSHLVEPKSIH